MEAVVFVLHAAAPELNDQLRRGEKNLGPGILSADGAARPAAGEGAPRCDKDVGLLCQLYAR